MTPSRPTSGEAALRCPVCAEIQVDEAMVVGHIISRHERDAWRRHLRVAATPTPTPSGETALRTAARRCLGRLDVMVARQTLTGAVACRDDLRAALAATPTPTAGLDVERLAELIHEERSRVGSHHSGSLDDLCRKIARDWADRLSR